MQCEFTRFMIVIHLLHGSESFLRSQTFLS